MGRHRHGRRTPMGAVLLAGAAALAVLMLGSTGTLSDWAKGALNNSADSVLTGSVAITHAYGSTSCTGTIRTATVACAPALGTSASAPATSSDQVTNNSTVPVTQSVAGLSCGVVRLADSNTVADPMLPRNGVTFAPSGGPTAVSGSGAITFGSGGYAGGVVSQSLPGSAMGVLNVGTSVKLGYGVWFDTTGSTGQIFGIGSQPTNTPSAGSTTFDRTLSLAAGKLVFAASGAATATTTGTFNNGAWHYAYVSLQTTTNLGVGGLAVYTTTVTIYVDGTSAGTSSSNLTTTALAAASGYWFLGGSSSAYTGSLSNFAVYNGTGSPTSPPAAPYGAATELWPLNDNGYGTATATLPTSLQNACGKVSLTLTFAAPAATVGPVALSAFGNGTPTAVSAPASGASQTLTIATSKGTSPAYTSDIAGLHLYVPIQFAYAPPGNTTWSQTFTWSNDPLDVFIA